MHEGKWRKVATSCFEVRGKTLGIVGYGHIGSQVGVLAESMGMRVIFYDIATKLPMGNNRPLSSRSTSCSARATSSRSTSPRRARRKGMIGAAELAQMKKGAYLLNLSRGTVVDIDALADGHQGGARSAARRVDVYPEEPESQLRRLRRPSSAACPTCVLTPHIGGSTEEAQEAIGREVATSLIKFTNAGTTDRRREFPAASSVPQAKGTHRILNVHKNVPGVLARVNRIVSELNANMLAQVLATDPHIGYLVMDLDKEVANDVRKAIAELGACIKTRILY